MRRWAWTLCAVVALAQGVQAQHYPSRSLRMVVAFPPGGVGDLFSRLAADKLKDGLAQPIIVENRPGGNTIIATEYVLHQPADGYTLYFVSPAFTSAPALNPELLKRYDPVKDFTGVARGSDLILVLVGSKALPAANLRELIAYGKANPGKLRFGTSGNGASDHLGAALFALRAGIQADYVHYKGSSPKMQDIEADRVELGFDAIGSSAPLIAASRIQAYGVGAPKRSTLVPALPAIGEALPGFDVTGYLGWVVVAATPRDIVNRLNREFVAVIKQPEVDARLRNMALEPAAPDTPEAFQDALARDFERWVGVVKDAHIKWEN
jgi:tripartite-type tricarboxylate transporter receptor subunit TctC